MTWNDVSSIFYLLIILFVMIVTIVWLCGKELEREANKQFHCCMKCDYSLSHLTGNRCPECGTVFKK
jgi:hypothetical protein